MADYIEVSAKTVDAAVTQALVTLGIPSDELEYEVKEEGSNGFLGIGARPAVILAKKKMNYIDYGVEFLESVFQEMGIEAQIEASYNEVDECVDVNISGENMGILIGKRGQTLDSLQYLTSLVMNKHCEEYVRVKLDTENYRERRKETLEILAKNIAYKVKRTKKPVSLEPMNPYERRIIHSALQSDKYVYTKSEGEDPYRHVVVMLRKEKRYYDNNRKGYYNRQSEEA